MNWVVNDDEQKYSSTLKGLQKHFVELPDASVEIKLFCLQDYDHDWHKYW